MNDLLRHLAPVDPGEGPLWRAVKRRLVAALEASAWKPGDLLPSEVDLARRFGVAVGTIRRAVDELVAEKALVRRQGFGTFVPAHTIDRTLYYFFHIARADGDRRFPETETLAFGEMPAPAAVAAMLAIAEGAPILRIRIRQRLHGRQVVVDDLHVPRALFPDLARDAFDGRGTTIYGLYQHHGWSVVRTRETLRAIAAPDDVAALVDLAPGAPMLEITRTAYAYGDRPVEVRLSKVDTREHVYFNELS
jgi:GntR family transcriptional regulator